MKLRPLLSLLLCAALLLPGCSPQSDPSSSQEGSNSSAQGDASSGETVPFALAIYPDYTLHPVLAENRANLTLAPLLYEPLFQLDGQFQPQPVLCQSYSASEDGLTWTFLLRSGVTFSTGAALTGTVVADALNLARQEGSRYAQRLSAVVSITGDESAVTIVLSRPNRALPALLDIPIALDSSQRPAGTGPYVLTETEGGLSLTARSGWWQNKTLPAQELSLREMHKADDLLSAFSSGDVGLVDVDLMGTNAMGYSGSYETWDYATTTLLYLGFNTQSGLCADPQARRALSLAIDRDSIAQTDYARHAVAAALPVHPNSPLYNQELAQGVSYNPEQLVAQLENLDVPRRDLELLVNSENTAKLSAAQRIVYQLDAAGVPITLKSLPFEDFTAALQSGDFDLYLGEVVLTADFDLTPLLSPDGALNYGRWQDGQISALLTAFSQASDSTREGAAYTLYNYLCQQMPIAPICFKNGSVLTQWGRLSGLSPVRGNVFYQLENWTIS